MFLFLLRIGVIAGSAVGSDPASEGSNPLSATVLFLLGHRQNGKAQHFDCCNCQFESDWPSFWHMAQMDSAWSYGLHGLRFESEYAGLFIIKKRRMDHDFLYAKLSHETEESL